jgi:toxin ParE1/3/4
MKRILKHEQAKDDLLGHASYIAQDNPDAALRLLKAAEEAFGKLAEMAGVGPVWGFRRRDLADVRFWPIKGFRNYLVFYRPLPNEQGVEVLRVLHGAMNIGRAMGSP